MAYQFIKGSANKRGRVVDTSDGSEDYPTRVKSATSTHIALEASGNGEYQIAVSEIDKAGSNPTIVGSTGQDIALELVNNFFFDLTDLFEVDGSGNLTFRGDLRVVVNSFTGGLTVERSDHTIRTRLGSNEVGFLFSRFGTEAEVELREVNGSFVIAAENVELTFDLGVGRLNSNKSLKFSAGEGPILESPDGTLYRVIVDNAGNLSAELV